MLDPDISTADARRLLSQPDLLGDALGPNGWTRRKFLQAIGGGVLGGAALGTFGDRFGLGRLGFDLSEAFAGTPIGAHDGIVINILLYGGNDGLNTVVPYTNGSYYNVRGPNYGNLAIPASQVLPLDGTFGLHPSLGYTKRLWDAGQLAIVHGVGYPNPDLSHFTSMAIWMAGKFGAGSPGTGWIGRWLDGQPPATADLMAATIGSSVPLHLLGSVRRAVAVPENGYNMFGTGTDPAEVRMYNGLRALSATPAGRGPWHDMFANVLKTQLNLAVEVSPVYSPEPTGDDFVKKMTVAARLINANLGFRVLDLGLDGYAIAVAINLTAVDATTATFVTAWPGGQTRPLTSNLNPVPGMAVPNLAIIRLGNAGDVNFFNNTGTVNLLADVVGYFRDGTSIGMAPLAPARLLDTRDGVGALGGGQMIDLQVADRGGVSSSPEAVALNVTVTGPTAGSYLTVWPSGEPRPFASSVNMVPGQTVPNMVLTRVGANGMVSIYNNTGSTDVVVDVLGCFDGDAAGRYVALSPRRVLDTRDGLGAPLAPVGQTPLEVTLLGRGGVPNEGVSGVMLNVTAVAPTANTFVTVYPGGSDRPLASNLNVSGGQVIPNMVLARLGPDGTVLMYNNGGVIDLVADVVGYFTD